MAVLVMAVLVVSMVLVVWDVSDAGASGVWP